MTSRTRHGRTDRHPARRVRGSFGQWSTGPRTEGFHDMRGWDAVAAAAIDDQGLTAWGTPAHTSDEPPDGAPPEGSASARTGRPRRSRKAAR